MLEFKIKYKCEKCGTINEFEPDSNFNFDLVNECKTRDDYSYDECSQCGALHEVQFTLSYRREYVGDE